MQKMLLPSVNEATEIRAEAPIDEAPGISLVDFLRVLRARRRIILWTVLIAVALTTVTVLQLTPLYTSSAVVMLDERKNNVADTDAVLSQLPSDQSTVQNQVQILTSQELAERVVRKLHLESDPEFNTPPNILGLVLRYINPLHWISRSGKTPPVENGSDAVRRRIAGQLIDHLSVTPVGLSTAMQVSYRSPDPVKAAQIANAFADAYVEDQLETKFEATKRATQWLSGRIQELSRQAKDADAAVQQYKARHNITETDSGSITDQQTAAISGQLVQARADLAEKQARYNNLMELQKKGQAANSAEVLSSPLIATLRAQETDLNRQLADLSSKYLPGHPKILDLQAQRANLEQKISQEVQRVVESVHNDVASAAAHVASLQQSLAALEAQDASQNQSEVQLTALESDAESARSMYEAFLERLSQAQGQEGIQMPDARIISRAGVAASPSYPKTGLLIMLSAFAGLLLGVVLAFIAERLDSGFRTAAQVEALLGLPVIAVVPEIKIGQNSSRKVIDQVIEKPVSSFTEAIRGLQLAMNLAQIDRQPKTITVTSSVPDEGKTTVAISLARVAARGGLKTLLIDGDLRRPRVANAMGLSRLSVGLIEVLMGTHALEDCLAHDEKSGVLILPCPSPPPNPADILMSQAMRNLLDEVQEQFDLVIIDSAPVLPVNDTKIIAGMVDGVVVTTRWEKTPREAIANALRSLADARAVILGIALTRAHSERFYYYSYGYQNYHNYGKYYSA